MPNFSLASVLVQTELVFEQGDLSRKNCLVAELVRVDDATRKTWQGIPVQVASNNIKPAPHEQVLLDKFSMTSFICSSIMVYPHEQIKLSKKTCQVKLARLDTYYINVLLKGGPQPGPRSDF